MRYMKALGFEIKYYDKSWRDGNNTNKAKSFALRDKPSEIFELVEDKENGYYSVHFKTTEKDSLTNEEKTKTCSNSCFKYSCWW